MDAGEAPGDAGGFAALEMTDEIEGIIRGIEAFEFVRGFIGPVLAEERQAGASGFADFLCTPGFGDGHDCYLIRAAAVTLGRVSEVILKNRPVIGYGHVSIIQLQGHEGE